MALRIKYTMRHRNLPGAMGPCGGPLGRITRLRKLVTEIMRYERIENNYLWLDESRGYVERLVQEAITHGDKHGPTMELADFWLLEKDLIHKLFKVYAPRYQTYTSSFTSIYSLPSEYPGTGKPMGVLELKGNQYPPIRSQPRDTTKLLTNILLDEAKREYKFMKIHRDNALGGTNTVEEISSSVDNLDTQHDNERSDDSDIQTDTSKDGTPV